MVSMKDDMRRKPQTEQVPTRVLIFSWMGIGDVLFLTPWLRQFTGQHRQIVALLKPDTERVLSLNPAVERTVSFDRNCLRGPWIGRLTGLLRLMALLWKLRRKGFDAVYIQDYKNKAILAAGFFSWLIGGRRRIGFCLRRGFGIFLTHAIPFPKEVVHEVERYRHLLGLPDGAIPDDLRLDLSPAEEEWAQTWLTQRRLTDYVVVHPGADFEPKRWSETRFAELTRRIICEFGLSVVITGTAKERLLATPILTQSNSGVYTLVGETSLGQLAALIKRARCVFTNDSGPLHIAVSQRTPCVTVFGPTDPRRCGPFRHPCAAVVQAPSPSVYEWGAYPQYLDQRQINSITVEAVLAQLNALLRAAGTRTVSAAHDLQ